MRLQDHIDFTALPWVKQELEQTLLAARQSLESYTQQPSDRAAMRACVDGLHQVNGTLQMVGLAGAAMVAGEMEALAGAILEQAVPSGDEASAALMRGLVQLPDYLERLSAGHRDVPVVLLPLLNELRAARQQPPLHEAVMFLPDLDAPLPDDVPGALSEEAAASHRRQLPELRLHFQQQLLAWFRGQSAETQLEGMQQTLHGIGACCHTPTGRRLWWIAGAVLDGVAQGALKQQLTEVRQLIGRVDRCIRQLIESGERSLASGEAVDLATKLLYAASQTSEPTARLQQLWQIYRLPELLPAAGELEHARGSMSGHNRALLDSVSRALKEDLLRVKEALDLFLRVAGSSPEPLEAQAAVLDRIGDTLGMLALDAPRQQIQQQSQRLKAIAAGQQSADEDSLLDLAGALLKVESALDSHIESLGAGEPAASGGNTALPRAEARQIMATLMQEAIQNTSKVREAVVAFIESGWQHAQLQPAPQLMDEVAGALRMLSTERPAQLALGVGRFIGNELIVDLRIPGNAAMDQLADALAALEYYLEGLREHRGGLEHVLDVAERSLAALGYWPPLAARAPVVAAPAEDEAVIAATPVSAEVPSQTPAPQPAPVEPLADIPTHTVPAPEPAASAQVDDDWVEIEEEVIEQVPVHDALLSDAGFHQGTSGIDDDIREIFLEEVQEEIDNLRRNLALWLADATQLPTLIPIRRAFHTLKGSGRLVGASLVGEFAWKIENMLNRVLDQSIAPSEPVQLLVVQAIDTLPQLLEGLKGGPPATAPLAGIMHAAEQLAAGHAVDLDQLIKAPATEEVRRTVRRRVLRSSLPALHPLALTGGEAGVAGAAEAAVAPDTETMSVPTTAAEAAPNPQAPQIDPVLLEILHTEVAQYLQVIQNAVQGSHGELAVDDSLMRAVHTLHGVIGMVELTDIAQMLSPLESLLKRLRALGQPLLVEGVQALGDAAAAVAEVMRQYDTATPQLPDVQALTAHLTALRDALPELPRELSAVLFEAEPASDEPSPDHAGAEPVMTSSDLEHGSADTLIEKDDHAAAPTPIAQDEHDAFLAEFGHLLDEPASTSSVQAEAEAEPSPPEPDLVPEQPAHAVADFATLPASTSAVSASDETSSTAAEAPAETPAEAPVLTGDEPPPLQVIESVPLDPAGDHIEIKHEVVPSEAAEPELVEPEQVELHQVGADAAQTEVPPTSLASVPDEPGVTTGDADAEASVSASAESPWEQAIEPEQVEPVSDHGQAEPAQIEHGFAAVETAEPDQPEIHAPLSAAEMLAETTPAAAAALAADLTPTAEPSAVVPETSEDTPAPAHAEPVTASSDSDAGGIDADLLEIFSEEAGEILDHADEVLAQWRATPGQDDAAHVVSLQRDLHTLKGGARIAGLTAIGDLAHALETTLEKPDITDAARQALLLDTLEASFDQLHELVQRASRGQTLEYPQAIIDRCLALSGQGAAATDEVQAESAAGTVEQTLPELLAERNDLVGGAQEHIRVRADLLDSLVNHAGEVAIYRSRLEQQVSGYRFNLVELDQTVLRLRSQLRMLEIETEAQIIARFQREQRETGSTAFDPLELDRYSQLQQYSRALAESVSDLVSIQSLLDDLTRQAESLLIQQSRVSSELQEGLLRTRMLPFDTMVPNLRRTLRQAANEQHKQAQLFVDGAHGEMDRNLLDRIKAPFEHMLRNAIVHGIESPQERRAAGKPAEGRIRIRVAREATEVVIRVSDDGRGLDRASIHARAVERGLLSPETRSSDAQLLALITQTGFSTASTVTQLAGRGVGMDVVANEIKQLGGSLAVESEPGKGTTFVMRLPFTLAVTQAILVRIGETTYAIPMTSVQGVARVTPDELAIRLTEALPSFLHNGEAYDIHDLGELLDVTYTHANDDPQIPLLLTRSGDLRAAIRIDAVLGSREIVVKSVGPQISSVPGILGATIMGDGSVLVILDLAPLVRHGQTRRDARLVEGVTLLPPPVEEVRNRTLVMVVDDSITMRKVTGRVLERHDYDVMTAKDGIDALEKLAERVPDLMLLDIEMPRMDGYELATQMKADVRLREVPIVMITSRTGEKHRQRAYDIGVERYLGKPYQESELLGEIEGLLKQHMGAVGHA